MQEWLLFERDNAMSIPEWSANDTLHQRNASIAIQQALQKLPFTDEVSYSVSLPQKVSLGMPERSSSTSSKDTCPAKPKRRQSGDHGKAGKKSVQFAVYDEADPKHFAVQGIYTYPAIPKALLGQLFWSRRETIHIRHIQKSLAQQYRKKKAQDIHDSILCLHGFGLNDGQYIEPDSLLMDDDQATRILTESSHRGLEHFMTSLICKNRHRARSKLLDLQESLKNRDQEDLEILLRVCSINVSSASVMYARKIAQGDERQALHVLATSDPFHLNTERWGRPLPGESKGSAKAA